MRSPLALRARSHDWSSENSSSTARFVYIEASDEYTLTGIEPANYALRFISGSEWVPACHDFLEADYFEFENALVFFEKEAEDNRVRYNTIEVTMIHVGSRVS